MALDLTPYYFEFLRYFALAKRQQELCNVSQEVPYGLMKHDEYMARQIINDDLMCKVTLYDVVERKYAGFSQIVNDCFYGWTKHHPYWKRMEAGLATRQREDVAKNWTGKHGDFKLPEWLYVFILHRVCGSGIDYASQPSGYHNTILFDLWKAKDIEGMAKIVNYYPIPFYTSVGYQFPQFPKPKLDSGYKRGGDYYLTEYAPRLARELAEWLERGGKRDLREIGSFMLDWNVRNDLKQYHFQYAAVVADIADFYPHYVNLFSPFFYGSNCIEAMSYMTKRPKGMKTQDFLDQIMEQAVRDTGSKPYDLEDVFCDAIRFLENYIRPGSCYDHLDFDNVWNSSKLIHPFGRQKAMLQLGLVKTFNGMKSHPSDDAVLKAAGWTKEQYLEKARAL